MTHPLLRILLILSLLMTHFATKATAQHIDVLQEKAIVTAMCVWDGITMKELAGNKGKNMATIYFGESVELLGEEMTNPEDKRVYLHARTTDGKEGWIHEYLFVKNGAVAVVTKDLPIYKKPNTSTTVTGMQFLAGEVVVMDQSDKDWVRLTTRRKERSGWVNGGDALSFDENEIEVASLIYKADQDSLKEVRLARLEKLRTNPRVATSPLVTILDDKIAEYRGLPTRSVASTSPAAGATRGMDAATSRVAGPTTSTRSLDAASTPLARVAAPAATSSMSQTEEIADINTGNRYLKLTEEGGILEVRGPEGRKNEFFCYHKSLPVGSEVFLQIPNNDGFVKVVVQNRLGAEQSAVIGLSKACIQALYGDNAATARAKIVYYKAK